jgi:hypothetical protein
MTVLSNKINGTIKGTLEKDDIFLRLSFPVIFY